MPIIRTPFVDGTIDDDPLTSGATTLTATELADLGVVASPDFAKIILDPLGTAGAPEIVYVTFHSSSVITATISRGEEGSAARQHAKDVAWVHGPTNKEYGGWELVGRSQTTNSHSSATAADLTTISGLNIEEQDSIMIILKAIKIAAAFTPSFGLKLNSTIVIEAVYGNDNIGSFPVTNELQAMTSVIYIGHRKTSTHLKGGITGHYSAGGASGVEANLIGQVQTADMPAANITDIIIRADSDGTNTVFLEEVLVYVNRDAPE